MLWLVVVDCEGVVPVALGVPCVAEGAVWVAAGLPRVPAPPGTVVVEPVPVWLTVAAAVPVAVPVAPGLPVVCAEATPMATVSANEASKVLCMKIAPWPGLTGRFSDLQ